eukprot:2434485-Rhodomonas_salina.1
MDARRVQRQRAARLMNTSEDQADFIPPYVDSKNNATRTEGSGGPGAGTSAKFAVAAGEKTAHNHSFSRKHNRNGTEAKGGHGGGKRAPGKKIEKTGDGVPLRVREAAKDFVYKEGEKVLRVQMLSVLFVPERRSYAFDFSVLRVRSADCACTHIGYDAMPRAVLRYAMVLRDVCYWARVRCYTKSGSEREYGVHAMSICAGPTYWKCIVMFHSIAYT